MLRVISGQKEEFFVRLIYKLIEGVQEQRGGKALNEIHSNNVKQRISSTGQSLIVYIAL